MIAARATAEKAMFCAVSRALAQIIEARAEVVGVVDRPLQHLHAAERAADRRERPLDAEVREQPPVHRDEVGTVNSGNRRPYGSPVAGSRRGRARSCPGSRRAGSRRRRRTVGVERLARADQVVPPAAAVGVAVVAGGVRVAGQRVADEDGVGAVGVERAVRLVGDLHRSQRRAGVEHERVGSSESDDPLVSTRPTERSALAGTAVTCSATR